MCRHRFWPVMTDDVALMLHVIVERPVHESHFAASEGDALIEAGAVRCISKNQELDVIVAAIHEAAGRHEAAV